MTNNQIQLWTQVVVKYTDCTDQRETLVLNQNKYHKNSHFHLNLVEIKDNMMMIVLMITLMITFLPSVTERRVCETYPDWYLW